MTERLTAQLAQLRLHSPSPPKHSPSTSTNATVPSSQEYAVIVADSGAGSARDAYRVHANPKDLQSLGLAADCLLQVGSLVLPAWPSLTVPLRSTASQRPAVSPLFPGVRLSVHAHTSLALNGSTVASVAPWIGVAGVASRAVVLCELQLAEDEERLLAATFLFLPTVQWCTEYYCVLGTRADPVKLRVCSLWDAEKQAILDQETPLKLSPSKTAVQFVSAPPSTEIGASADAVELVGGLDKEIKQIQDAIQLSLKHSHILDRYRVRAPRGILLYGPPGTGKTLLARFIAQKMNLKPIFIDSAELTSRYYGESEGRLRQVFEHAQASAPSLIFIDEIDSLCPKREQSTSPAHSRLVATLLTLMDGLSVLSDKVFILAATNSPDSIDSALRRSGRFDREIEIGIPTVSQRKHILRTILQRTQNCITKECLSLTAERAHGFVGADLSLVCKEATLACWKRSSQVLLCDADLEQAFALVKPSAIREILLDVPKVSWEDIGGQALTKQKLKESVEWPLKHPEKFLSFGIKPPKGVLLYGPPGCSKTLLAKALATESGLNFLAVKGPELFSKWVGDSEKAVREMFRKARMAAPSIIFFDEFDAVGAKRSTDNAGSSVADRVLSQLLCEMDGIDPLVNVTIVAATNRPDVIDPALLRPGRFDRHVYVSLPDFEARREILSICSRKMPFHERVDLSSLASMTEGYSGAEISALCQEAGLQALKADINATALTSENFLCAAAVVTPRTPPEMLDFFEKFAFSS